MAKLDMFEAPWREFSLTSYDWIVVNTSGGKDSQAMTDFVVGQARAAGVLDRVLLVHCDLKTRVEWPGVRELVEKHAAHYGVALRVVSRPQGDLLEQVEARGMWPSSTARYCTSDQKRGQVHKVITSLRSPGRRCRVLNCMGFRSEESPARAKRQVLSQNERLTNSVREVDEWLPIHSWSVAQVWECIRASGVPYHYAYDLGMPRLSCMFCIFAPESALLLAGKHNPEALARYVATEEKIGHTFRHNFSLASVQAKLAAGHSPGPIQNWTM